MMQSNGYRAVLWDMDGVLTDTGEFHFQTWVMALNGTGIAINRELFTSLFGMNNTRTLENLTHGPVEPALVQQIGDEKERLWREAIRGNIQLLPGVGRLLADFKRLGFRQAVASSAPPENIEAVIHSLQIGEFFDALVSGSDIGGKPDPAIFLTAAERLGIAPQNCLVFEDSIAGVEAARRAGMHCIAVTTTNPRSALTGAERVVDSLEEIHASEFAR